MGVFGFPLILSPGLPQPLVGAPVRIPSQPSGCRVSESESRSGRSSELPGRIRVSRSESWPTRGSESASPSLGSESASGDCGSCWCAAFPPRRFSLTAVRCARLPQGGRATRPLLGAGYRAGAGGTLPHSWADRLAVWVRLPQSAARSAPLSTRAVGSSPS